MENQGEIILYQPNKEVKLEVRLENETVWLNRQQLAELFARDVKTIGKHINNALKEELAEMATVAKFAIVQNEGGRTVTRQIEFYNLDMILSVGYRVKSNRGIEFRRWSNRVLKNYLLKGYSINQRLKDLEEKVDTRLRKHEKQLDYLTDKVDFFVRTSLPAKKSILLIDNYVDDSVLLMLSKRDEGVTATIYTHTISKQLELDIQKHNSQYSSIEVKTYKQCHDRFLIIDNTDVYHIGASLKDLGKKMFAFSRLDIPPKTITDLL